jgi:hypothetical protein
LSELLEIARAEHLASQRGTPFIATVFAPFSERWLDDGRPERARLRSLGVERLILLAGAAPDVARIQSAARMLKAMV